MTPCFTSVCRIHHPPPAGPARAAGLIVLWAAAWLALLGTGGSTAAEPSPNPDLAAGPAAPADPPAPPTADQIDRWIRQLGDDSYAVRRSAADQLLAAGSAARPALQSVTDGPDPEVRAAARRLVTLIDRTEFDRRLRAFAADADGRRGTTLPGWDEFRTLVGGDARARALFVDMQRAEATLLRQVFGQSAAARDSSWEDRLLRLLHGRVVVDRRRGPPLGSCATMLFLGSLSEPVPSDRTAMDLARLAEFPPVREAMQSDRHRDAMRRLVVAWVVHCANHTDPVVMQRLQVAKSYVLADAVSLAVAVARGDPEYLTVQPGTRATAILTVGKLGGPEHVDDLEPLLEDTTECMPARAGNVVGRPAPQVQIRDVALAVMLHLTNQDPQQYGFAAARRHARNLFDPTTLYMSSDAERTAAIEKWHQWKADHAGQQR